MTKRKSARPQPKSGLTLYRLTGPEGFSMEHRAPADTVALSWAVNRLSFREGDDRPGDPTPAGDFKLTMIGGTMDEPLWTLRKTPNDNVRLGPTISWEAA